jgi:hypothetical protein
MSVVEAAVAVARAVLPLVAPGSAPALEAAEKVLSLLDRVSTFAKTEDWGDLGEVRAALEARIVEHSGRTIDRLEGG